MSSRKCPYLPLLNNERLNSARTHTFSEHTKNVLKVNGYKLKKVDKVRFLGVIIDDNLNWDHHIAHLESKLLSCIVMIKRIKKFIPSSYYNTLYHSLFVSHLTYCISAWGGVGPNKLGKIFAIQKRCIRLLFGDQLSFDHPEFYETCARARTYKEHTAAKNYALEHTKPLFRRHKILTVHNLYTLHTLIEAFKILKYHSPTSMYNLLKINTASFRHQLILPRINLEISRNNFVFKASSIWNQIIPNLLQVPNLHHTHNIIIPGSCSNSDLTCTIGFIKSKTKLYLSQIQNAGDAQEWMSDDSNFRR